jgi:hypothetical protein
MHLQPSTPMLFFFDELHPPHPLLRSPTPLLFILQPSHPPSLRPRTLPTHLLWPRGCPRRRSSPPPLSTSSITADVKSSKSPQTLTRHRVPLPELIRRPAWPSAPAPPRSPSLVPHHRIHDKSNPPQRGIVHSSLHTTSRPGEFPFSDNNRR